MEKREALNASIKQQQNKLRADERKSDTRRKVLAGATVLEWARRDSEFSSRLMTELRRFLVRDADRELFGLPPLPHRKDTRPKAPRKGLKDAAAFCSIVWGLAGRSVHP